MDAKHVVSANEETRFVDFMSIFDILVEDSGEKEIIAFSFLKRESGESPGLCPQL